MIKNLLNNIYLKFLKKLNTLARIKLSLTIIAIFIYMWFYFLICLIYINYKSFIYETLRYFFPQIHYFINYTIGHGSVLFPIPAFINYGICNDSFTTPYASSFVALSVILLFVFLVWIIVKNIFFFSWIAKLWPFKELIDVFEIIMLESPFTAFALKNLERLFLIFLSFFNIKERFSNKPNKAQELRSYYLKNKTYITELQKNLYDKAKEHYEKKDAYMINIMKAKEHTINGLILKNLSIITMESDIIAANVINQATALEINMMIATK